MGATSETEKNGAAGSSGRFLLFARAMWLAVTTLTVGQVVAGTYAYWVDLLEVCTRGAGYCLDALSEDLVMVVRETVQPAHAGLWRRGPGGGR